MHNINNAFSKKYFYLYSIILSVFMFTQIHAAPKGTPGSQVRTTYCKSKLDSCIKSANEDCEDTYYSGSSELSLCTASEVTSCKNSYGSTSDCLTRDRTTRKSRKAKTNSSTQVVAPVTTSTKKTAKDKIAPNNIVTPNNIVAPNNRTTTKTKARINSKKTKKAKKKKTKEKG